MKQRYRLYGAEMNATQPWRWFGSPQAAQLWIDAKVRTKFWRKNSDVRHVKLIYPYMGKMSGAHKDGKVGTIDVLPESLAVPTIIHELAHLAAWVPGNNAERDHGPRYAAMLIECYRHFDCAATADKLIAEFDEKGVKYG